MRTVESYPRWMYYVPAAMWAAFLLYLGGLENVRGPSLALAADKIAHLFLYAVLGLLAARGWVLAGRWPAGYVPLLLIFLIGGVDEWHQSAVPGRSAELADLVADSVGVLLGFAAGRAVKLGGIGGGG